MKQDCERCCFWCCHCCCCESKPNGSLETEIRCAMRGAIGKHDFVSNLYIERNTNCMNEEGSGKTHQRYNVYTNHITKKEMDAIQEKCGLHLVLIETCGKPETPIHLIFDSSWNI